MRLEFVLAVIASLALSGLHPTAALSRNYQCSVTDPTGDASDAPGQGFNGEPYQDMVKSSIERMPGAIIFAMELASAIPNSPRLKNPNGLLLWMWGMNTGTTVPQGYPLPPGLTGLLEFWVHLAWDGQKFYAEVIDRRPVAQGGVPIVTAVPFVVDGRTVRVIASPALFDDPAVFRWGSTTWNWSSHLGSAGGHPVDRAPDSHATDCAAS